MILIPTAKYFYFPARYTNNVIGVFGPIFTFLKVEVIGNVYICTELYSAKNCI